MSRGRGYFPLEPPPCFVGSDGPKQLSPEQKRTLREMARRGTLFGVRKWSYPVLRSLIDPINCAADVLKLSTVDAAQVRSFIMRGVQHYEKPYWSLSLDEWRDWFTKGLLRSGSATLKSGRQQNNYDCRTLIVAVVYIACRSNLIDAAWEINEGFHRVLLARRMFGSLAVDAAIETIDQHISQWGTRKKWKGVSSGQ